MDKNIHNTHNSANSNIFDCLISIVMIVVPLSILIIPLTKKRNKKYAILKREHEMTSEEGYPNPIHR